jgi:hypothetical protein
MRSNAEYSRAMGLAAAGLTDSEIARQTGIDRTTIRHWRKGGTAQRRFGRCESCGHPEHDFATLPRDSYAYLLGMYLGDGHISEYPRSSRLRITMCLDWLGIINECEWAMRAVFPDNKISICRDDPRAGCADLGLYSRQLPCMFPQHGPGPKHLRKIELAPWQAEIVAERPGQFVRGLIHSDGCRSINRVHVKGKTYEYPRYTFTSASDDIRGLFTAACDQLGVEWRRMNARNISIARREAVARLDEFVGPSIRATPKY